MINNFVARWLEFMLTTWKLSRLERHSFVTVRFIYKLEMWVNAQPDGRLPNIGGALCPTPQFG